MRPPAFTLRQLQYAVAVAETGGFRRAADACHVAQPSLSAQLAQLEDALGVRLFERDRRRVLLTVAGGELVERARRLLADVDDLAASAAQLADPLTGTLRLGVIPTIAPYALPDLTPALGRRFPRLRVLWREERTPELVRAVAGGALDGALLALEADLGDLERAAVASDEFLVAAARAHPLARGAGPVDADRLEGETVLLLEEGHCLRDQVLAVCSGHDAREGGFRATSLTTLVQMVAGGAGVTLLPELALPLENRRGELAVRPLRAPVPRRTLGLVWRRRSPLGPSLERLAAALRDDWHRVAPPAAGRAPGARPRRQARTPTARGRRERA